MTVEQSIPNPALTEMGYADHLKELRKRLIYIIAIVMATFFILLPFAQQSYTYLADPLIRILPSQTSMIATDVMATFLAPFKLNLYLAVLISFPLILHQVWLFIAPALYRSERHLGISLIGTSTGDRKSVV